MNYTDEQIKLTDNPDIQALWSPISGDQSVYICSEDGWQGCVIEERMLPDPTNFMKPCPVVWIPQERWYIDRLMESEKWAHLWTHEKFMLAAMLDWIVNHSHPIDSHKTTLDILQQFYMHIIHGKKKNNLEWETEA